MQYRSPVTFLKRNLFLPTKFFTSLYVKMCSSLSEVKRIKHCIVPSCKNSSRSCPDKIFFRLPLNECERRKWLEATGGISTHSPKHEYCCEDHFDAKKDVEDYLRTKWCLENGLSYRARLRPGAIPFLGPRKEYEVVRLSSEALPSTSTAIEGEVLASTFGKRYVDAGSVALQRKSSSVKVDTSIRSTAISSFKRVACESSRQVTPKKKTREADISEEDSNESAVRFSSGRSEWVSTTTSTVHQEKLKDEKTFIVQYTTRRIAENPKGYVGVPFESYTFLLQLFSSIKCLDRDILLTLKKLKLNQPFFALGDDFGITASQAYKVFIRTLPRMASELKDLIFWPDSDTITKNLPITFRRRYFNVKAIIDCFEIPIQKPSDPLKQALTWSECKKANTMKYMVSCTPYGFISFISKGYGGRTTDANLASHSQFPSHLVPGDEIMADRGFKSLAPILHAKGASLVRLSGKEEVKVGERIAVQRRHVARVVGRLRVFKFIFPETPVSARIIPLLDATVLVIAALCNLKNPLIK